MARKTRKIEISEMVSAYKEMYLTGKKSIKQLSKEMGVSETFISQSATKMVMEAKDLHKHMTGRNAVQDDINRAIDVNKDKGRPPLTPEQFYDLNMVKGWKYPDTDSYDIYIQTKRK